MLENKIHRIPRLWSNDELRKFGHLFSGDVVNVSAWQDKDKEGNCYREYFPNKASYTITNFEASKRGFQGTPGEVFLDLEKPLHEDLEEAFDVVFNHTTLEHTYEFRRAFGNLCNMTRDVVIIVVPFVQQMHGTYGDYWRFSPEAVVRLMEENHLSVAYLSFNNHRQASVYVFAIGVKDQQKWQSLFPFEVDYVDPAFRHLGEPYAGCNAIRLSRARVVANKVLSKIRGGIFRRADGPQAKR